MGEPSIPDETRNRRSSDCHQRPSEAIIGPSEAIKGHQRFAHEKVGCHNVHLRCESTDIEYVLSQYNDQGQKLDAAHSCLREKCGHAAKASAQATLTEA